MIIIPIQEHYKPDGWLLFLVGQLLCVDFTKYDLPRAMDTLLKELRAEEVCETNMTFISQSIPSATVSKNIFQWTSADVQHWLTKQNLTQMSRLLINCDGRTLLYLHHH